MSINQRKTERHHVRFKLVYDDGHTFNAGSVADVSEGGIFLETSLPLPVGTIVRITPLDPAGGTLFEVQARVVRSIPYHEATDAAGMGVEFLGLSDVERKSMVALIRKLEERAANFEGEHDLFLGVMIPSSLPQPSTLPPTALGNPNSKS